MTAVEPWIPCEDNGSGHTYGDEELAALQDVLRSGVLIASRDGYTQRLETEFAQRYGVREAITCSSCTTGLQGALSVADLPPQSEVVTTPMTDIGGASAILQAGLTPVFADIDEVTGNLDPDSVEKAIGPQTRALVVTHLVGRPCDLTRLMEIAVRHQLFVVEDCAQAYDARHSGQLVGTFGHIGVFSTQQTKHISAGEGGLLITDDPELAFALRTWTNKGVAGGIRARDEDHPVVGMNARMTELQAAVALAQLHKLTAAVAARIAAADELSSALGAIPGLTCPSNDPGDIQTYWKYLLGVDPGRAGLRDKLALALEERGAIVAPCYLHLPLFEKTLFTRHPRRLVGMSEPTFHDPARDDTRLFPGMRGFIERAIVLWWNERITSEHVRRITGLVDEIATAHG